MGKKIAFDPATHARRGSVGFPDGGIKAIGKNRQIADPIKSIRQQQASVVKILAEDGRLDQCLILGIDERDFIPHTDA